MNTRVGQLPQDTFPGPYGPPAYGYHPQPCRWDPNATRLGGAWVCDGYPPNQVGAHVGQTTSGTKTTGELKGNPRPLWRFPYWGFGYGWPWYGMPQASCYFDPWQGVWVCPASPWVYNPYQTRWFMGPISQPWWGRRHHPWGGQSFSLGF